MSRSFDDFPVYDKIALSNGDLSPVWRAFIATFSETLKEYLSETGVFVPHVTTDDRDAFDNVMTGQLIYNTTTNKFQGYNGTTWDDLN